MGYRGKVAEREAARQLRAEAFTLDEIAAELGVAKSSVSLWVRDVEFTPRPRARARRRAPNKLQQAKAQEIAHLLAEGRARIGDLSERDLSVAGTALYAGEGFETGGSVGMANSDPRLILFFCTWLRQFFDVDESRLRLRLYLHDGLDLDAANEFWSDLTGIPTSQFGAPYRAAPDPSRRSSKHLFGCPAVRYSCTRTLRAVLGLVDALVTCNDSFRGSSIGRAAAC